MCDGNGHLCVMAMDTGPVELQKPPCGCVRLGGADLQQAADGRRSAPAVRCDVPALRRVFLNARDGLCFATFTSLKTH